VPTHITYIPSGEARAKPPRPPNRPRQRGAGGGGKEDEDKRRVRELYVRMNRRLREANLTQAQRREYRQATRAVIARMSSEVVHRLHANTTAFRYYPTHEALIQAIKAKYPALAKKLKPTSVIKGMLDKDGTVHMDGGGTIHGRQATITDFHAHELTHGIDGVNHGLSESEAWGDVWAEEIVGNDAFTRKARADYREAFSEVGSLLLGAGISANELALLCPGVVRFWKARHRLLAGD
jgi:hypothetical protein